MTKMANFVKDNEDLGYYLDRGIDWDSLLEINETRFGEGAAFSDPEEAKQVYRDMLEMMGEFAADEVAPHSLAIDEVGVHLKDGEVVQPDAMNHVMERIRELEIHGMCLPRELGGMNAPFLMYLINTEVLARADVSVMAHHGFHGGMALAMLLLSIREGTTEIDPETHEISKTRFAEYIEEIRQGNAWGCMDITEPDAGSDMAALKAVGEQDEDGNWFVTGQKIFITSGHGKYHFVIARTEKAGDPNDPMAGLSGLSMFLVPTYEEDADGNRKRIVTVDRVEEKMGHHGSATAALTFDRAPAHLVGQRGEGFKYMLVLMNNARLSVGFESIGLCEAAHRIATAYAAERRSMGKPIERHEMIADYLEEMQTDIQALRAMAMHGGFHEEMAQKLTLRGLASNTGDLSRDRAIRRHQAEARRVTPLLKYLASERAVEMGRRAVQILGGAGYMREYGAEKLVRDAMVMPIYEGTSQIQALMAMKDTLGGIMKNPRGFVKRMAQTRWRWLSSRDPLERRVARIQMLSLGAQQHLLRRTAGAKVRGLSGKPLSEWPTAFFKNWDPKRDFAVAMLHAERLTQLLADELVCEILLGQAKRHPERADVLERYLERAEPRSRYLYDSITSTGGRLLSRLSAAEDEAERAAG
ncbi:MAG: acyl-CoA dehydrogenase family protein [Polyangiaceae bacterium]|nr:acyl-CoA dehydrogenase family protein [Polyangiaceae bacterium]